MRSPAVVVARNILRIQDRVGSTTGSRSGFSSDETAARNTEGQGISRCPQPKLKSHLLRQSWLSIMARHCIESTIEIMPSAFIRALPKAELHLHLEGAIPPQTLVEVRQRHGHKSTLAEAEALYQYKDFLG